MTSQLPWETPCVLLVCTSAYTLPTEGRTLAATVSASELLSLVAVAAAVAEASAASVSADAGAMPAPPSVRPSASAPAATRPANPSFARLRGLSTNWPSISSIFREFMMSSLSRSCLPAPSGGVGRNFQRLWCTLRRAAQSRTPPVPASCHRAYRPFRNNAGRRGRPGASLLPAPSTRAARPLRPAVPLSRAATRFPGRTR